MVWRFPSTAHQLCIVTVTRSRTPAYDVHFPNYYFTSHKTVAESMSNMAPSKDAEALIEEALSKENVDAEVKEAKSEIDGADDEDEGVPGDFEVTKEEMSVIRAELACEFPDDYNYLR